jgi:hypothetical protein
MNFNSLEYHVEMNKVLKVGDKKTTFFQLCVRLWLIHRNQLQLNEPLVKEIYFQTFFTCEPELLLLLNLLMLYLPDSKGKAVCFNPYQ